MKSALLLTALIALLFAGTPVSASEWRVDYAQSRLGFIAKYDDIPFNAWFKKFSAHIVFDPAKPGSGLFDVTIDISSIDSNSRDRDEGMLNREWFHSDKFSNANFLAKKFTRTSDNEFSASGMLTIKGITKSISLPFTWSQGPDAGTARLIAELQLDRRDFEIGTGEWAEDPTIGYQVKVVADLRLTTK